MAESKKKGGGEVKRWHSYVIKCPKCEEPTEMADLAFTRGGDVLVICGCRNCKAKVKFETNVLQIMVECAANEPDVKETIM